MTNMTIGKKITLACGVLVGLTIILGTVSILNTSRINNDVRLMVDGPLPGIASVGVLQNLLKDQKTAMVEHMASSTPERKAQSDARIADLENKYEAELKTYEKTIQTEAGRALFEKITPLQERVMRTWTENMLPLSRALKTTEALAVWQGEETSSIFNERATLFDQIRAQRHSRADEIAQATIAAGESATFWSVLLLVLSVASGGALAFFIVRGINKALSHAVTELGEGAEQVSSAAGQVSSSRQSLAQGASEQAASLQETSASSEEMSSMTRKNSENSQQAAEVMNAVSQRVADANRTLADMTTSMHEIGESSGKISKIIKVIDEIAFQTNILALNAAVEAARAGEAGMGFAVVADEVRNLAQRSAQAAKDTAALIEDSIVKSGEGSRRLGEVAASIQAITEGATKVKMLVDEVEASSKEQATGIQQISKAVSEMDQVTQKTAANAEESASASEQLSAQSQALLAVVEQLQAMVGAGSGASTVPRRAEPAKRPSAVRAVQISRGLPPGKSVARRPAPALAGGGGHRTGEFPLDDSEFKEF